ncbi:MAG: arylsulfotransferase family protein [Planctomycetaceae bacterium]
MAFFFFMMSIACFAFGYGMIVVKFKIYPFKLLVMAESGYYQIIGAFDENLPWYYIPVENQRVQPVRTTPHAAAGINVITKVDAENGQSVRVLDIDGRQIHEWKVDWFNIWPDAGHLPDRLVPQSAPGSLIHGNVILPNGDLVFSFEQLGLVRLNRAGDVVWRLPYQTHHSVHLHDDGNLWVCGQFEQTQPDPQFPHRIPPFDEVTLLEVSPDGEILSEWSVAELLKKNGRAGLLYLGSLENRSTSVQGDLLHLNNVEPFSLTMEEGFFTRGDVLVSLRNINTVFVFNRHTEQIKYISTGMFVRQHDPDFIDGDSFSVFDNNNVAPEEKNPQSKIVIVRVPENTTEVFFEGTPEKPFYTDIMGKHQWLPNGHLLITEATKGRAFEIDRDGEIVWEYVNQLDEKTIGIISDVTRLPVDYAQLYGGSGTKTPESPPIH